MNYDRIILELMDRVAALEDEVETLKSKLENNKVNEENIVDEDIATVSSIYTDSIGRDTTKYILDGKKYGKSRLVLAIVKKYMKQHPYTTESQLLAVFDRSLQGSLGVVRELEEVKVAYADYERRFFVAPDDVIKTTKGICVVCNQWGIGNIGNLITRAKQLGIEVAVVK